MYNQLPMYQRQGKSAFKKDLTNIRKFCDYLGNPQKKFKSIHVGGTNGKGSTSTIIAHVLKENNYSTGLYTSPHLTDYRERIQVDFNLVSKSFVVDFITQHREFLEAQKLSFFEMSVGMAFNYFADQEVDMAVIEVGLGGRLDSTNIIQPEIAIITNIGYDHMDMLGNTLPEIASEKAGIIKKNTPVVIGEKQIETNSVFEKVSESNQADLYYADSITDDQLQKDILLPQYQYNNIATAEKALHVLVGKGVIQLYNIRQSIVSLIKTKGIYGKFMQVSNQPNIILDAAHNIPALESLSDEISKLSFKRLFIVFGSVKGKDIQGLLKLMPKTAHFHFCQASVPRAMPIDELAAAGQVLNLSFNNYKSPAQAYLKAIANISDNDLLIVTGSTFLIAELLNSPEIKNKLH
jgi:dihydrofolate synthase/folylpolyglutamate synthase